jgi:hypothetical protein
MKLPGFRPSLISHNFQSKCKTFDNIMMNMYPFFHILSIEGVVDQKQNLMAPAPQK